VRENEKREAVRKGRGVVYSQMSYTGGREGGGGQEARGERGGEEWTIQLLVEIVVDGRSDPIVPFRI